MGLQTATNPTTGESVVLVGDQWQPVTQSATNKQGAKAYLVGNQWLTDDTLAAAPAAPSEIPGQRAQPGFFQRALDVVARTPQTAYGLLEVPTAMVTGAAGNLVGIPAGIASTFGGGFGTPQAARTASERAAKIARAMTYEPRTEVGQTLLQNIAKPFEGLPPYVGGNVGATAATLGPAATSQAIQAGQKFLAPSEAKLAKMTAADYARGPQIDAVADARRMGLLLRPTDIQPTAGPRVVEAVAGRKGGENVVEANKAQVRKVQLADMGMPETAPLNRDVTFDKARGNVAQPYDEVAKLPIQQADDAMIKRLESLRADLDVIGAEDYAPAISKIVDDAIVKTDSGLTGEQLLKNITVLRERAKRTYSNKSATTEALDIADTNLKVATELESLIDNSISNPKLLKQFRDAREKMARIYAYEGATNLNTGLLDVNKLARITAKNNNLTGDIAALGRVAGNFPYAFEVKPKGSFVKGAAVGIGRSTPPGALGGLAGFELTGDYTGAIVGSLAGALGGKGAQKYAANMLASPGYQAALKLRDLRSPLTPAEINYTSNMLAPYQPEVVGPSKEGAAPPLRIVGYDENDRPIYAPSRAPGPPGTGFTTQAEPGFGAVPTPFAQRGLPNEIPRQTYEAQKRAELAQEFRARAERKPTKGGIELIIDAAGNLVEAPPTRAGGAIGALSSLESAVQKLSGQVIEQPSTSYKTMTISPKTGAQPYTRIIKKEGETTFERGVSRAFDLTAEERIAWNKAKADLAEVVPGMKSLSNEAVAARIADRNWTANAVASARAKVEALARQDALLTEQLANRDNLRLLARDIEAKQRQLAKVKEDSVRIRDLADMLDETMRAARPDTSRRQQGPKTRAAKRNALAPDSQNNLAP
jgi:hypothetical protein